MPDATKSIHEGRNLDLFSKVKQSLSSYPWLRAIAKPIYNVCIRPFRVAFSSNARRIRTSRAAIKAHKGIHAGKRCFIIGNGPSLTSQDLDLLKHEICFASNRIMLIFDKTDWRPSYYCVVDKDVIREIHTDIENTIEVEKYIVAPQTGSLPEIKGAYWLPGANDTPYPGLPKFADEITNGVESGHTITFVALQLAVYMGFREIVLLGVDHNYSVNLNPDGTMEYDNTVQDYFDNKNHIAGLPQIQKMTLAYHSAKQYADAHGIKIYNATRGGKLEVFERVKLEDILSRAAESN